jgi:hypothetical protein
MFLLINKISGVLKQKDQINIHFLDRLNIIDIIQQLEFHNIILIEFFKYYFLILRYFLFISQRIL